MRTHRSNGSALADQLGWNTQDGLHIKAASTADPASTIESQTLALERSSITIYQPEEELGNYDVREITKEPCDLIVNRGGCWSLDHLVCRNDQLCLKWGGHCYAGRVSLPKHVKATLYGNFHCNGDQRGDPVTGPQSLHDFWNYHRRTCSFHFEATPGHRCPFDFGDPVEGAAMSFSRVPPADACSPSAADRKACRGLNADVKARCEEGLRAAEEKLRKAVSAANLQSYSQRFSLLYSMGIKSIPPDYLPSWEGRSIPYGYLTPREAAIRRKLMGRISMLANASPKPPHTILSEDHFQGKYDTFPFACGNGPWHEYNPHYWSPADCLYENGTTCDAMVTVAPCNMQSGFDMDEILQNTESPGIPRTALTIFHFGTGVFHAVGCFAHFDTCGRETLPLELLDLIPMDLVFAEMVQRVWPGLVVTGNLRGLIGDQHVSYHYDETGNEVLRFQNILLNVDPTEWKTLFETFNVPRVWISLGAIVKLGLAHCSFVGQAVYLVGLRFIPDERARDLVNSLVVPESIAKRFQHCGLQQHCASFTRLMGVLAEFAMALSKQGEDAWRRSTESSIPRDAACKEQDHAQWHSRSAKGIKSLMNYVADLGNAAYGGSWKDPCIHCGSDGRGADCPAACFPRTDTNEVFYSASAGPFRSPPSCHYTGSCTIFAMGQSCTSGTFADMLRQKWPKWREEGERSCGFLDLGREKQCCPEF